MSVELGRRALLETGPGLYIVASEYGSLMHDPEILRSMGLEPANLEVIVQKSHKLFRPAYRSLAGSVVQIDTPGFTDRNIRRLPYRRIPRPIYPLDELPDSTAAPRIQVFRRARS
jgi:microcystin degradation protein MlrC